MKTSIKIEGHFDVEVVVDGNAITVWINNDSHLFEAHEDGPGMCKYHGQFFGFPALYAAKDVVNKGRDTALPSWDGRYALTENRDLKAENEKLRQRVQELEDDNLAYELHPIENGLRKELAKLRISVARIAQAIGVNGSGQLPFVIPSFMGVDMMHDLAFTQPRGWNSLCGIIIEQAELLQRDLA